MKQLICVSDIEALIREGSAECVVTDETLITPAATDLAEDNGVAFVRSTLPQADLSVLLAQLCSEPLLQQLIKVLEKQPYVMETDSSGFQLIRGDTIHYEASQETAGKSQQRLFDSFKSLKVDLVTLEKGVRDVACHEEMQVIIKGRLVTMINGKQFDSKTGDSLYYPPAERVVEAIEESQLLVISSKGGTL